MFLLMDNRDVPWWLADQEINEWIESWLVSWVWSPPTFDLTHGFLGKGTEPPFFQPWSLTDGRFLINEII